MCVCEHCVREQKWGRKVYVSSLSVPFDADGFLSCSFQKETDAIDDTLSSKLKVKELSVIDGRRAQNCNILLSRYCWCWINITGRTSFSPHSDPRVCGCALFACTEVQVIKAHCWRGWHFLVSLFLVRSLGLDANLSVSFPEALEVNWLALIFPNCADSLVLKLQHRRVRSCVDAFLFCSVTSPFYILTLLEFIIFLSVFVL